MTILNNPDSAWEYDGFDLSTYAYNIRVLGANEQIPARRGENIIVGGRQGRLHVPKLFDQRTLALGMFVNAKNPQNKYSPYSPQQFLQNIDALKHIFAQDGIHILKHKYANTTRLAYVEVQNVVEFVPRGPYHYDLVVEFIFADPFWYAEEPVIIEDVLITFTPYNVSLNNPGTYKSEKILISITGYIANPKFQIDDVWVSYNGIVNAHKTLVINTNSWEAFVDGNSVIEFIEHDNALRWLEIPSGISTLTIFGDLNNINYPVLSVIYDITYI